MFDVRNNPAHWPSVPEWDSGCGVDETWAFSGNIYRPICRAKTMSPADVARNMRFLEDTQIQRSGGDLGYWQASTAPVIVQGGGDPAYHGQYDYAGHYWGYPFYQNGNKFIYFARAWQLIDASIGYPAYTGSGASDYPWELTHWISGFGNVSDVPTFSRGGGGSTVSIPRWPVNSPIPPGVQPWQPGFYVNDTPYQPFMGYAEDFAGEIYNNDPYADIRSGDPYQWASTPLDLSNLVENPRPAPGSPTYVDTVDATGNPVIDNPILQTIGGTLANIEGSLSNAVGGNGTIFGFSPLMVLGVAGVALWLMTKK